MSWRETFATALVLASSAALAPGAGRHLEFSAEVGPAWTLGTSYERVYSRIDDGALSGRYHKLSELIWDLEGLYGIRASVGFELDHNFELRASGFSALSEGSGGMVDYDWFLYDRPDFWTHRSRSTTEVTGALDLDLRGTLRIVRNFPVSLDAVLGWRYMMFRWEDRGIDYVYSSLGEPEGHPSPGYSDEQIDPGAVRDLTGTDTRVGILYEQVYHIPYVGGGAGIGRGRLRAKGEFLYSPIATARDRDQHVLRGLDFEGTFIGGTYTAWKASLTYRFTAHVFMAASYESQKIAEFRGDIDVADSGGGYLGSLENGASVQHQSRQAALVVGVNF
jgi:plasminogen activator